MHILTRVPDKTKSLRIRGVAVALSIALGSLGVVCSTQRSVKDENVSGTVSSSKRMPDGKQWTTENLKVDTAGTYCFDDAEQNCRSIWPFIYVGVRTAGLPITRGRLALADRRRVAATGEASRRSP